jgi:hypothetical protein
MDLYERLYAEIVAIFRSVQYGQITFFLSPEQKTMNYSIKTTGKLSLKPQGTISLIGSREKNHSRIRLTKSANDDTVNADS